MWLTLVNNYAVYRFCKFLRQYLHVLHVPMHTPTNSTPTELFLTFSDPANLLSGLTGDDTATPAIAVTVGNGFIFVEEHSEIYVRKNYSDLIYRDMSLLTTTITTDWKQWLLHI